MGNKKTTTRRALMSAFVIALVSMFVMAACSAEDPKGPNTSTIASRLMVNGMQVDSVDWEITGVTDPAFFRSGTMDTSGQNPTISIDVVLPAGDYSIKLSTTTLEGFYCEGSYNFTIVKTSNIGFNVPMQCNGLNDGSDAGTAAITGDLVPGDGSDCADINWAAAYPTQQDVGLDVQLEATSTDAPNYAEVFSWTQVGGTGTCTPASANSANTSCTCTAAGDVWLEVSVSNPPPGVCVDTWGFTVTCI